MNKIASILALGAAFTTSFALAAIPKEGDFDYTACWTGTSSTLSHDKDHVAETYELIGTTITRVPGTFGDRNSFRCVGMTTTLKGKSTGGNLCEATDPDGDKRFTQFWIAADGTVTRQVVSGTGKYAGMEATSKVEMMGAFLPARAGTTQACNRQTGTYKLK